MAKGGFGAWTLLGCLGVGVTKASLGSYIHGAGP